MDCVSVCLFVYIQFRALWLVDAVEWGYIALSAIGRAGLSSANWFYVGVYSDACIGGNLKQISFVLVLIFKKQNGLICFSLHHQKLNQFDLF